MGLILVLGLSLGMVGCGNQGGDRLNIPNPSSGISNPLKRKAKPKISEVSPPEAIQKLRPILETYQPQVTILNPRPNQTLQDTTLTVQLDVQDLPIYQDPNLDLGPHLEVILDNEAYTSLYDLSQPVTFTNLNPGTHTLRVFATTPWGESFKNEGAYAQTTFHIFTKTEDQIPNPDLPLLTYSNPIGTYGAQPILLDFYLSNAPLHVVAQENPDDNILDWRIRASVNGEEFILDQWEPLYLQGFDRGNNWVKLEILDELGNPINNIFNTTARLVTYDPQATDPLSQLIRGEISAEVAQAIVDPDYIAPSTATPETETETEVVEPQEEPVEVEEILEVEEEAVPEMPEVEEEVVPEMPEVEEEAVPEMPEVEEEVVPEMPEVEEEAVPETPEVEEQVSETPESEPMETVEPEDIAPEPSAVEEETEPVVSEPPAWRKQLNLNQWRDRLKSKWNQLDLQSKWNQLDFDSINPFGNQAVETEETLDTAPEPAVVEEPIQSPSEPEPLEEEVEAQEPQDLEPEVVEEEVETPEELEEEPKAIELPNLVDSMSPEEPIKMAPMESTPIERPTQSSETEASEWQQMLSTPGGDTQP
ncbi:hypothetical protein [Roseofilum capinflatum]|uniref:FHA domain containing protein n=1 Tax=Roseofilum capinflatum BLCC-M114 TaxID=3022440 RepID=A0ABT7B6Y2_9CYAN|nr:hypothetical protein [Roseofilum capinflatum]MDJ1174929.1 hypothetical protein [Roseofilum capinflatum BLCC-M114]